MNKEKLSEILSYPDVPIIDVIKLLNKTGYGMIIIVNQSNQLIGTITDGDLRRAMLKGITFDLPCEKICNRNPIFAKYDTPREEVKTLFDKNSKKIRLNQIPLLNEQGEVVDLALRMDFMTDIKKNNIVVIMAGGLGSRLSPLTLDCPKPLLKISGKPVLEILLESFIDDGFTNFLISVNYKADMIRQALGDGRRWNINLDYLIEDERLGTAGPLSLILNKPDEPFFVINSDILTKVNFNKLLDFHLQLGSDATLCIREHEYVVPYGVVELSDHRLVHIQEKPVHNCFVSTGIYVLSPSVLDFIPKNIYFDMNELLTKLVQHSKSVNSYPIHEYWLDIGRIEDLERAHQEYQTIFQ